MTTDRRLHKQVEDHPYPLLFTTISGAHLYGFPSPDSDYDLRGVHLLPLEEVVGLKPGHDTIEKSGVHDGLEIDLVTHDARKFFELMLKKNGYVLEQVLSPLVVYTTPEHMELMGIATECVTRHHAHHYLGFAETQWKLFQKADPPHVKPLLYVYRVLLTGIHMMRTGKVEANLVQLNDVARLPYIPDLIERKMSGPEKGRLEAADLEFHQREYERLRAKLQQAFEESKLPEVSTGAAALHDLLVRLRLKQIGPGAWGRQLTRHFADVIANVYRRPEMYVGSDAEPHAIDCVLWTMHRTWADAADNTSMFFEVFQSVLDAEECGATNFHRRFCERHPKASDKEAMDYVLACWQRVSESLGICELDDIRSSDTTQSDLAIRPEHPNDSAEIRAVVEAAFSSSPLGHHAEADLVESLRNSCPESLSLVAKHEDPVVGHVLFSPVVIEGSDSLCGMGLGPVAVSPEFQRRGIGMQLIRTGIEALKERGCSFICVLGWPHYYSRFGFQSAQQFGIDSEFGGAADGTFQILWLRDHPASLEEGMVRYRPEFSSVGHHDAEPERS